MALRVKRNDEIYFLRDPLVGCAMLWVCRKEKMKENANEGARRTMDAMAEKRSAVVLWKAREL